MERDLGSLIRNRRVQIAGSLVLAGAAVFAGRGCLRGEQKAEPTPTPIATLVAARTAEPTPTQTATVIPTPVPTEEPTPPPTPEPPPPTPKPPPPTPVPTPVRTPEPTPTVRPNRPPQIISVEPFNASIIFERAVIKGLLIFMRANVRDPDGDALSCSWAIVPPVPGREIKEGNCAGATINEPYGVASPEAATPNIKVTITASDGKGGVSSSTFHNPAQISSILR